MSHRSERRYRAVIWYVSDMKDPDLIRWGESDLIRRKSALASNHDGRHELFLGPYEEQVITTSNHGT